MSIVSEKGSPGYSDSELQDWVRTQEAAYGEISRIGNEDGFTLGSFYYQDSAHPRPEIEAAVVKLPADAPPHAGELCRGTAYVGNVLTHVVVYRPTA